MAGMQGLGRVIDVVGAASGNMISMKNASAVSFICYATSTTTTSLTVVAAKTYGGGTTTWTPANGFGQPAFWYQNTAHDGTAAWTKVTASWSSQVLTIGATSGYMSVVDFYTSQFADGFDYIQVTGANTTYVVAVLHDLTVQRTPANLAILGA
jgi:hypothetical protein